MIDLFTTLISEHFGEGGIGEWGFDLFYNLSPVYSFVASTLVFCIPLALIIYVIRGINR